MTFINSLIYYTKCIQIYFTIYTKIQCNNMYFQMYSKIHSITNTNIATNTVSIKQAPKKPRKCIRHVGREDRMGFSASPPARGDRFGFGIQERPKITYSPFGVVLDQFRALFFHTNVRRIFTPKSIGKLNCLQIDFKIQ